MRSFVAYSLRQNLIRIIDSRGMRLTGVVAHMGRRGMHKGSGKARRGETSKKTEK
jgi:hypothetical protein